MYDQHRPEIVQAAMDRFAALTGRAYHLFDYVGDPDGERVIIVMGSGAEPVEETVRCLNLKGEKVGVVKVHLFRPFSVERLVQALPASVRTIAVLDRTKEPGRVDEPLYLDVVAAMSENTSTDASRFACVPRTVGGRYGLASIEFTPGMVKEIFDELNRTEPKRHFTIGIADDVTHLGLAYDSSSSYRERPDQALPSIARRFAAAGADGLVFFNRFYQPDFDVEALEVIPRLTLSTATELRLPLHRIAILYGRVPIDLVLTTGVHGAENVLPNVLPSAKLWAHQPSVLVRKYSGVAAGYAGVVQVRALL